MFSWLGANAATVIISVLLLLAVIAIIRKLARGSVCGCGGDCGCGHCGDKEKNVLCQCCHHSDGK